LTGDQHIAQALHAVLQRQGMPVKIISSRAMQVMVDMLHDLMERIMDEAATCADSKGRVTIASGSIRTGAMLVLQNRIDANCPHVKIAMISFAGERYAAYLDYIDWEQEQAAAVTMGVPSTAPPDRPRPAPLRLRPLPNRFVADHLRGVRGIRPLTTWDY
jgi:histone H3/H4